MSDLLCNLLTITKTTKVDCDRAALASIAEHVQAWHVRELEHCETLERIGLDRDRVELDFDRACAEEARRQEAKEDERAHEADALKTEMQLRVLKMVAEVLPTIVKKVLGGADDTTDAGLPGDDIQPEPAPEPRAAKSVDPDEDDAEDQTWDFINFVNETMARRDADSDPVPFAFRFHGDMSAPPASVITVTKASALWAQLFTIYDDDFWTKAFAASGVLTVQAKRNSWTFTRGDALISMMDLK